MHSCGRSNTMAAGIGKSASTPAAMVWVRGGELRTTGEEIAYVALLGPTDAEHHWRQILEPGAVFETVPVAIAVSDQGLEGALGRLTEYRRANRRRHDDHRRLPVVFNDFMNTLMGDPTTERLLPLVAAAARVELSTSVSTRAGMQSLETPGGNPWAHGGRPRAASRTASPKCWTPSGAMGWFPACGWSRRW